VVGLLASFGIGALYGDAAVRWAEQRYPRLARLIGFLERAFARFGAPLLVVAPLHALAVLAGAAGSRFGPFIPAVTAGQLVWVSVYFFFGDAISGWTAPLIELLSENLFESTLVCIALVVLYQLASRLGTGRKEDA